MADEIAKKVMEQKDTLLGGKPAVRTGNARDVLAAQEAAEAAAKAAEEAAVEAPAKRSSKMIDIEADDK